MPRGRMVRQDDATGESLTINGSSKCNEAMAKALTGEGGPLPSGMLPGVKCATEAGQKALCKALDDEGREVSKKKVTRKPKNKDETSEPVKPKTPLEPGFPGLRRHICLSSSFYYRPLAISLQIQL